MRAISSPYDAVLLDCSCNRLININFEIDEAVNLTVSLSDPARILIVGGSLLLDHTSYRLLNKLFLLILPNQISSISAFILRGWMPGVVLR
jgi:hypothetical protein